MTQPRARVLVVAGLLLAASTAFAQTNPAGAAAPPLQPAEGTDVAPAAPIYPDEIPPAPPADTGPNAVLPPSSATPPAAEPPPPPSPPAPPPPPPAATQSEPPLAARTSPSAPEATPPAEPEPAAAEHREDGFKFGTYGRVGIAWDGRGGTAQPFSVVSHGPRLEQPAYLELDAGYGLHVDEEIGLRMLATIAFFEELFHFSGNPTDSIAIRNLYVESTWKDLLTIWAGSRMYRGDDVYLFDWWPMDNLNTVGGGVGAEFGAYRLAAHVGMNRLDDEWQTQWFSVPDPVHGAREVMTLDRPRTIASLKAERLVPPEQPGELGWKVALYGEGHFISSGTLLRPDHSEEWLPDDQGWVAGAQGGLWNDAGDFLNLWVRTAGGLAAYGEMAIPFGVDQQKRARDATEFALVAAGNVELGMFGLLGGTYARWFRDADRNQYDLDDGWEFAVALRPHLYLTEWFHVAAEISYQLRRSTGLAPESEQPETPQIWKFALMPMWVPMGPGTLSRPQIRFVYQISLPNDAARNALPEDDPRREHDVEHFVGLQVEWWYNSSYR